MPVEMLERIVSNGRIAELRKARKCFKCAECEQPIEPREYYYSITLAGSGLGSIKFPDRVHMGCVMNFLNRRK